MRDTRIRQHPAAATDIKLLIGDSVDKVPKAGKLVGQPAPPGIVFQLDRAVLAGSSRPRLSTTVHS